MSTYKNSPSSDNMEKTSPTSNNAIDTIEKIRIEAALLYEKQLRQFYERIHKRISDRNEDELEKSQIHGWRSRLVIHKPSFS
jgi:CRISPR/Cas system CSM-associated protein Csm2 small subunit